MAFLFLGALVLLVIFMQVRAFYLLKNQNKIIQKQSDEIRRQNTALADQNMQLLDGNLQRQQIIGVVSHDLKGPFNRIFALVQLLKLSGNVTEEQQEYIEKINQTSVDGLNMVKNLLDARELEERDSKALLETIDISDYLSHQLKDYASRCEQKNIQLIYKSVPGLKAIADKSYLSRIVENLISNGFKFSESGKKIEVILEEDEEMISLSVLDEGPGISQEDQHLLFKRFQKLSAQPTAGESSTGLGLSIVKTLTEKMGGSVRCESELGKGARFTVTLRKAA